MRIRIGWLVLGVCMVLTHQQLPVWSSDLSLWTHAASVSPRAPRPAVNLAAACIQRGQWADAERWANRAELLIRDRSPQERDVVQQILDRQYAWIDAFSPSR